MDLNESLLNAARNGSLSGVKTALENGANVNTKDNKGITPLMYASVNGQTAAVKLLIENDANVNEKANDGWTALMRASFEGHTDVVKLLEVCRCSKIAYRKRRRC